MHRISTHIEHLLLVHDCVIIPGFGGFVLQSISGTYNAENHLFSPMWKEVVFNTALQHNDGLLTESYMQVYSVDYQKARQMLEEDVHEIKSVLKHYLKITFGTLGSFSLGLESQLIFRPNKNETLDINNYGLSTFSLAPLAVSYQEVTEKHQTVHSPNKGKEKREIFYVPVNRRLIRTAVASVAAIGLFLLISTPVKDVNQSAYTASFIPSEVITSPIPSSSSFPAVVEETTVKDGVYTDTEKALTIDMPAESPVIAKEGVKVDKPVTTNKQAEVRKKMHHIVIASFPSEAQAKQFISRVDKNSLRNVNVVYSDRKYRVYADKFDNRNDAEAYVQRLRANSIYHDAWVFTGK